METSPLSTSKHMKISAPIQISIYTMISLKLELVMVLFKMVPCTCITRFLSRKAESRLRSSHVFTNPESTNFKDFFKGLQRVVLAFFFLFLSQLKNFYLIEKAVEKILWNFFVDSKFVKTCDELITRIKLSCYFGQSLLAYDSKIVVIVLNCWRLLTLTALGVQKFKGKNPFFCIWSKLYDVWHSKRFLEEFCFYLFSPTGMKWGFRQSRNSYPCWEKQMASEFLQDSWIHILNKKLL